MVVYAVAIIVAACCFGVVAQIEAQSPSPTFDKVIIANETLYSLQRDAAEIRLHVEKSSDQARQTLDVSRLIPASPFERHSLRYHIRGQRLFVTLFSGSTVEVRRVLLSDIIEASRPGEERRAYS